MRLLVYSCQCGWLAHAGEEDELVAAVQGHTASVHGLTFTNTQVLALSEWVDHRVPDDSG